MSHLAKSKIKQKIKRRQPISKSFGDLIDIIQFIERVSAKISVLKNEDEIFRTIRQEFIKSKKYTASILLLTDGGSNLKIVASAVPAKRLRAGEKIAGFLLKEYKIDLARTKIYSQVIKQGRTIQVTVDKIINELFPRPLAYLVAKATKYQGEPCILTPLRRGNKITGALAVSSTELVKHFIPSVRNLAQHISNALALAYENRERRWTEEALRESEFRYRALFKNVPVGIGLATKDGQILAANEAMCQMSGYSRTELRRVNLKKVYQNPRDRDQLLRRLKKDGFVHNFEVRLKHKNGTSYYASLNVTPLSLVNKGIVLTVAQDITKRKQIETEVKKYSQTLENKVKERTQKLVQANKLKSEFLADVSHELRTPLSTIKTNLDIIQRQKLCPHKEEIHLIQKTINKMTDFVNQLIEFSQIDSGERRFKKEIVDLRSLVKDVFSKFLPLAQQKNISIEFLSAKPLKISGDQQALEIAIANLVSNAIRYNKNKGKVKILLSRSGTTAKIIITDTGMGILQKDIDHIFERFYRVDKSRSREKGGIGLGLAITKEIIEAHQGRIEVVSTKGKGSKFTIFLPL